MKKLWVILTVLFIISLSGKAQDLSGTWKGSLEEKRYKGTSDYDVDRYNFEVDITQHRDSLLRCTTITTKEDSGMVFYGKATAYGILSKAKHTVLIREQTLLKIKTEDPNQGGCLMTCYLTYKHTSEGDELSGTFSSKEDKHGTDCGNGTVFLKRVPVSEKKK